jgi:hypothetical protein
LEKEIGSERAGQKGLKVRNWQRRKRWFGGRWRKVIEELDDSGVKGQPLS